MKKLIHIFIALVSVAAVSFGCIYEYEPKVAQKEVDLMVIDGSIAVGGYSSLDISLTVPMGKDAPVGSIKSCRAEIETEDGKALPMNLAMQLNGSISFMLDTRSLDPAQKYRCVIYCNHSGSDKKIVSEWQAPVISSAKPEVSWKVNRDSTRLSVLVSTQGESGTVGYYKWNYHEDWEVVSYYYSEYYFDPQAVAAVRYSDFDKENRYYCWKKADSEKILVNSTEDLTENKVVNFELTNMSNIDDRMQMLYAINVDQVAISQRDYQYWNTLNTNTDDLGGIFSPQPSEHRGNVSNEYDADEHVLGFVSVGQIKSERLFISPSLVKNFYHRPTMACEDTLVDGSKLSEMRYFYRYGYDIAAAEKNPDTGVFEVTWARARCVDCRLNGTKERPDYWPLPHY
ncbi:MAG: DUF4249 family protein [Bacteroidales bacterium]|nr:DUF4249 family protein [Bacteroidales bacterium]